VPQICQRVEQKGDPVPGTEASEDLVVEDEKRHDVGRAVHRRMKGRIVVHAEIAGEEDESGAHRLHRVSA
jgi:hypothetical protein